MAYEHNPGWGTLFKNDKYTVGGKQPYAFGSFKAPDGTTWEASLWVSTNEKIKGFSLKVQPPRDQQAAPAAAEPRGIVPADVGPDFTDDLPF